MLDIFLGFLPLNWALVKTHLIRAVTSQKSRKAGERELQRWEERNRKKGHTGRKWEFSLLRVHLHISCAATWTELNLCVCVCLCVAMDVSFWFPVCIPGAPYCSCCCNDWAPAAADCRFYLIWSSSAPSCQPSRPISSFLSIGWSTVLAPNRFFDRRVEEKGAVWREFFG